jgi:hypothetical protein
MSVAPSKIPKVRTYAADLNLVRSELPTSGSRPVVQTLITTSEVTSPNTTAGIPPFHTFSHTEKNTVAVPVTKKLPLTQAETQKTLSSTSMLSDASNIKESMPAVIITDTKHKRFKLTKALSASISNWWAEKKQTAGQKKIPRYTVPEAGRRKGVIQKATAKTGRASTADHSAVVSRIKATKQIPHTVEAPITREELPVTIKSGWETDTTLKNNPEKTPIVNQRLVKKRSQNEQSENGTIPAPWESPLQAQVNALSEQKNDEPSAIILTGKEFTRIKQQRSLQSNQKIVQENQPEIIAMAKVNPLIKPIMPTLPQNKETVHTLPSREVNITPTILDTPLTPTPIIRPKISPIIPQTLVRQEFETPSLAQLPTAKVLDYNDSLDVTETGAISRPPQKEERRFAPPAEDRNPIFSAFTQTNNIVFLSCGALIVVVAIGFGIRYLVVSPERTAEIVTPLDTTVFPDTTLATENIFISDINQLRTEIQTRNTGADSLVEINFTNELGTPLSGNELLDLFDATVPFDFTSSITFVAIGIYRGETWIILTVSDKNTAFGGMLAWEPTIGRDLQPLFTTLTPPQNTKFSDTIIEQNDARVLKNSEDKEALVYGFTSFNKLLITTNTTAFLNLAEKINAI